MISKGARLNCKGGKLDPFIQHLEQAFELVVEGAPRKRALRCSSLPYCPILDAAMPVEPERVNLEGALYMGMGTVMHTQIQTFLALAPLGTSMWGSWKCATCNKIYSECLRPDPCCDVPLLYVEASLRVACMTGHVDFIAQYPGGRWVLVDFKTIGEEPRKAKRQHLLQVRHYVAMLKMKHNIQIDDVYIGYIGRAHLNRWPSGPYDARRPVRQTREWIFRAIDGFKAATQVRRGNEEFIKGIVEHRPCKSVEDHEDYMSRRFEFEKKPCPMLVHCSKGDKACTRAVRSLIDGGLS